MSIKAPKKVMGIQDPDKDKGKSAERPQLKMTRTITNLNTKETRNFAEKANQTNASKAGIVQIKEGVRTSMGTGVPFHNPPGNSKKGKPK